MKGADSTSTKERLISGVGATIAVMIVFWMTRTVEQFLDIQMLLLAPMAATSVLLFATPHAELSQPWNVIGGHVLATLVGVALHRFVSDPVFGGASAAGLAILLMRYANCLHPPAGASAVIPFVGGAPTDGLGFGLAFFPVGADAMLIVALAVAINYPFEWRRYPRWLVPPPPPVPQPKSDAYPDITHADLVAALGEIDTFVDISEEDLLRIYELATRGNWHHGQQANLNPES